MSRILKTEITHNIIQAGDSLEAVRVEVCEEANGSFSVTCWGAAPGVAYSSLNTYDLPTYSAALGVAGHTFGRLFNLLTN